jgi:hypothetical protein
MMKCWTSGDVERHQDIRFGSTSVAETPGLDRNPYGVAGIPLPRPPRKPPVAGSERAAIEPSAKAAMGHRRFNSSRISIRSF